MAIAVDTPADTTMMRIVHDALRRDLARAQEALGDPRTGADQRRAIGSHLGWMMEFLQAHHASEDEGLYPFVRARAVDPVDCEVIDRMSRSHEDLAPAMTDVGATAAGLAAEGTDTAAERALAAVDVLAAVLLPHLREEEDEAMPVVSRSITAGEWNAIDKEHNLDPKSKAELGFEGHWLIDGASDADRATVVGLVPPIPRFLLLHGYAGRYRRHAVACWGHGTKPPRRVQLENQVSVTVAAEIDDVWDVVSDVTRVGEWSHECVGADWLGEAAGPAPGARFRGRNRAGRFRWGRVCEIVSADPYELVWITVPTALYPDSSEWRITLAKDGEGTVISQQFRVIRVPPVLGRIYALLIPSHRDRTADLVRDLERLGAVASRGRGSVTSSLGADRDDHPQLQ